MSRCPLCRCSFFSSYSKSATGNDTAKTSNRASPPKFPQEALDQLFIIKSKDPPPTSWSDLLDHFRSTDGSISVEVEHELLKRVADSKNRKLLERATDKLEWNDPEALRLLIVAWTRIIKDPKRAAGILLNWPDDRIGQPPTLQSFRLVLTALSEMTTADSSKLAREILELLCDKYSPTLTPDRDCFHKALVACSNDPQAAEDTLLRMIQHAQKHGDGSTTMPNISTYRLLFSAWANSKQDGAGLRSVELLRSCPVEPDNLCCNLVLNALASEGDYDTAEALLFEMVEKGIVDRISFYTLFNAYTKAGTIEATEKFEALLRMMEGADKTEFKIPSSLKLPNGRAYASVIGMWTKLGNANRAWELLKRIEKRAMQEPDGRRYHVDQICYQSVIGCLSKKGNGNSNKNAASSAEKNAQRAQDLLETMSRRLFRLNLLTCNTVLKCWASANDPNTARKRVLDRMVQEWGVAPDVISYNTVIQAFARKGDIAQAEELLDSLLSPSSEVQPNFRTFTAVMTALSKQKTVQAAKRAEALLWKMQELHKEKNMDTCPNVYTYNSILSCWAMLGDGKKAEFYLRDLQRTSGTKPDVVSYNSVIRAQKNDLAKAEVFVEEMIQQGIHPDNVTKRTLMNILNGDKSITNKKEKARELMLEYFRKL
eukprot:scaffold22578_cov164-Cylindrotheca_fusiformis.AAC.3